MKTRNDGPIPRVGWRYMQRRPSRATTMPITVLTVIEPERRCIVIHDGANRRLSVRFDMIWTEYNRLDDTPQPSDKVETLENRGRDYLEGRC